jgi:hypothetical protein
MKKRFFRLAAAAALAAFAAGFFHGGGAGLKSGTPAPELAAGPWLNSPPLKLKEQRGKVVMIDMWTFS